jgi:hypothetical protein
MKERLRVAAGTVPVAVGVLATDVTCGICNNVYVMGTCADEYVSAQQVPADRVEKAVGQKVFPW